MKRPWFQFHLSTAIILMFVAGGLLWANMSGYVVMMPLHRSNHLYGVEVHGWPVYFRQLGENPGDGYEALLPVRLVVNVGVNLALLGAIGMCCEWRIRRQQRTTNNKPRTTGHEPLTTDN